MSQLFLDAAAHPLLFLWSGALTIEEVQRLRADLPFEVPADLEAFWASTGGGSAFETEEFLAPIRKFPWLDGLLETNQFLWTEGLPGEYLAFDRGLGISAVRKSDGMFVSLGTGFSEDAAFTTLDQWYVATIRAEYAERYGLAPN